MNTNSPRIRPEEIDWLLRQHPLQYHPSQLQTDYGEDEAAAMLQGFLDHDAGALLPLLSVPGVGTRWRLFLDWSVNVPSGAPLENVFAAFAQHLGRLTSYRALALTTAERREIDTLDAVRSSGHRKTDLVTLMEYVRKEGLRKVLDTRMRNISAFPYDPSLSLHDHPEIAVCIAEGYMQPPSRPIHRFELDLPVIETIGWRMCDVNGLTDWFPHRGILFDPTNPRTERFALYEIPFFSSRCKSIRVFTDFEEVSDYLLPFAEEQGRLRRLSQSASG